MMDKGGNSMKKHLRGLFLLLCIIIVTFVGCDTIDNTPASSLSTTSTPLKVHYIDVGESDCTLIQYGDKYMMIDAGDLDDTTTILNYLEQQNVRKIEYLILTHPHADHIGSAANIINNYDIEQIMMPSIEHTTKTFENVIEAIANQKKKIKKPIVGDTYEFGDASFTIMAPNNYNYGDNLNNYSISLKLTYQNSVFLFIGDCETQAIDDILSNGMDLSADVYMCGHHGSDTSTTKELLDAVKPTYAVISVGSNSYGHPCESTLDLLKKRKTKVYRTDETGTIIITSTGTTISVNQAPSNTTSSKDNTSSKDTTQASTTSKKEYVYITESGKKYHKKECRYVQSNAKKITLKEAKEQGYDPCSACH